MNELVQILKNTRQHLMTGVSHDSLRGIGRYFAGGFRHVVWQRRSAGCRSRSESEKLFDIGVAGLTLMVPFLAAYIWLFHCRTLCAGPVRYRCPGRQQLWCGLLWCADRRDYWRHRGALPEENSGA